MGCARRARRLLRAGLFRGPHRGRGRHDPGFRPRHRRDGVPARGGAPARSDVARAGLSAHRRRTRLVCAGRSSSCCIDGAAGAALRRGPRPASRRLRRRRARPSDSQRHRLGRWHGRARSRRRRAHGCRAALSRRRALRPRAPAGRRAVLPRQGQGCVVRRRAARGGRAGSARCADRRRRARVPRLRAAQGAAAPLPFAGRGSPSRHCPRSRRCVRRSSQATVRRRSGAPRPCWCGSATCRPTRRVPSTTATPTRSRRASPASRHDTGSRRTACSAGRRSPR